MAASSVVSSSPFNDLAEQFDGEVILPGAPDYDARRAVWNGMIDRRPACIALCKSARDVQRAVKFARAFTLISFSTATIGAPMPSRVVRSVTYRPWTSNWSAGVNT